MSSIPTVVGSAVLLTGASWLACYATPFAFKPLAEDDKFFTYISAGDGKRINQGKDFFTFYISLPGHHLNHPGARYYDPSEPEWEILPNERGVPDSYYDLRPTWMRNFGYYWVGIPGQRSVHERTFAWAEYTGGLDANDHKVILPRREPTSVFKVNTFQYAMVETEIMTKDGFVVKVVYGLWLRITNPHIATIALDDWLRSVALIVSEKVRNFIGAFEFIQLISLEDEADALKAAKEDFSREITSLTTKRTCGVTIIDAKLDVVLPFGPASQQYLDALGSRFVAETKADVVKIEADAAAYDITTRGAADNAMQKAKLEADAQGRVAQYKAVQDNPQGAATVLGAEALGKAGTVYVVPGSVENLFKSFGAKLGTLS